MHNVYMVSSQLAQNDTSPASSTDPRSCHLPDFDRCSDQADEEVAGHLRAFPNQEDATTFMYACNLETVWCVVYRREADKWIKDEREINRFLDNI